MKCICKRDEVGGESRIRFVNNWCPEHGRYCKPRQIATDN